MSDNAEAVKHTLWKRLKEFLKSFKKNVGMILVQFQYTKTL